jgi:DNA-binding MarR family transcriptional regulator
MSSFPGSARPPGAAAEPGPDAAPDLAAAASLAVAAAEVRQGVIRLARRLLGERTARPLSIGKLSVLADLIRESPVTAGKLAAAQNQRPQSLTRVLAELAQEGLIIRTRGDQDHRQVMLEITAAGREAVRREMAGRDAWLSVALADLTDTEREVLRLAGRLMDRLAGSGIATKD